MRLMATCCSHRNTALALIIVTIWASFSTRSLFGVQFQYVSNLLSHVNTVDDVATLQENLTRLSYNKHISLVNINTSCNTTEFPGKDDPLWLSLQWREQPPKLVLYNRVPKTGSSVTLRVINTLARKNGYKTKSSPINVFFNVSLERQEAFVQSFYSYESPLVFDRHIYFVDFTRFGNHQPMYINTVREPIAHYLSFYYFMRKMSMWKHRFTEGQSQMSLEKCLNTSGLHCEPHRQYRFFCGQDPICRTLTSEEAALAQAKRNIERYYAIVGLSEDIHGFFSTLEVLAPDYFKGAAAVYNKHKNDMKHFTTKKVQDPLSPETEQVLRDLLKYDFDLYHFAKQRFNKQKCLVDSLRAGLKRRHNTSHNSLKPKSPAPKPLKNSPSEHNPVSGTKQSKPMIIIPRLKGLKGQTPKHKLQKVAVS